MEDAPAIWAGLLGVLALVGGCAYGVEAGSSLPRDDVELSGSDDGPSSGSEGDGGAGGSVSAEPGSGGQGGENIAENTPSCGDGVLSADEECDDGNTADADGCTSCAVDCADGDLKDPVTHHCYRFVELKAHWQAAENDCVAWGGPTGMGHLVSIASAEEQELVQQLGSGTERWIGATDIATEETYVWIDGTPFGFDNWRSGEPNNDGTNGGEEDCAEIEDDGRWDDQSCDKAKRYICERSAVGVL